MHGFPPCTVPAPRSTTKAALIAVTSRWGPVFPRFVIVPTRLSQQHALSDGPTATTFLETTDDRSRAAVNGIFARNTSDLTVAGGNFFRPNTTGLGRLIGFNRDSNWSLLFTLALLSVSSQNGRGRATL